MPLLAGDVIDAARDRHAAFGPQRHPNKGALRYLSGYAKVLYGKILAIDPDLLRIEITAALPLGDFDAGIALPANTQYVAEAGARYPSAQGRSPFPITIIDSAARNAFNAPRGAAWRIGNTLYMRGPATAWRDFDQVAVSIVALPATLTVLEDVLAVPDAAELACVEAVALHFAGREVQENKDSPISLQRFAATAAKAEDDYLETVRTSLSGKSFFTQDVWRPT